MEARGVPLKGTVLGVSVKEGVAKRDAASHKIRQRFLFEGAHILQWYQNMVLTSCGNRKWIQEIIQISCLSFVRDISKVYEGKELLF